MAQRGAGLATGTIRITLRSIRATPTRFDRADSRTL